MSPCVKVLLVMCVFGASSAASAQGCPPGQYPVAGQGWNYCAPVPGAPEESASPQPVGPKWRDQWQATAVDTGTGALGTSIGKNTADEAESGALLDCRKKGGVKCEVQISLVNGCVAMAVGEKVMNTKGAPTKEKAISEAMTACTSEDSTCKVYYTQCSMPFRTQ
jgi:Domain of unknown function (DUF4189)